MKVLVIGKSRETLEKVKSGLAAKGIIAHGTTEIEMASVHFDANDYDLVAFGGGVETPIREKLKSKFRKQNRDIILLDTFAPIAVQHIAAAMQGDLDKREFASRFEVSEHERAYRLRLDVMKACDVRVEVYHLGERLQAETLVERHIPSGPFEARIDENRIRRGLNMILVMLEGKEFYFQRIERR